MSAVEKLPACPFCGSDQVYEISQSTEKRDGTGVTFDAAECDGCCAQAPLDMWIAFCTGYAELKTVLNSANTTLRESVRQTQAMNATLAALPDINDLIHGD